MSRYRSPLLYYLPLTALLIPAAAFAAQAGQNPAMQQRLAELKQSAAQNKRALAQYTWQDQQTVTVKGEVKKQELYNVRLGPDGKPQKTLISSSAPQQPQQEARGGPFRRHIVEKKKEDFAQYAKEVGALAQSYAQIDPQKLQRAFERGDVNIGQGGAPGEFAVTIANYIKPNDSLRLLFNSQAHAIQRIDVSSYLANPKDAVTMEIQFAQLPDGTNHVSEMTVNGVSKQLTIQDQNSNYVRT